MPKQGKKRSGEEIDDADPHAARHPPPHEPQKALPKVEPFAFPEDISMILPSDLPQVIHGFRGERYVRDLVTVFSTFAGKDQELEKMHQRWYECRQPTLTELWQNRGSGSATNRHTIWSSVATLRSLLEKIPESQSELYLKVSSMLFDYIMLMRIDASKLKNQDQVNQLFPDYLDVFESLATELQANQSKKLALNSAASTAVDHSIPAETRDFIGGLRLMPHQGTPLAKIAGYQDVKDEIDAAISLPIESPHLAAIGLGSNGILIHGPSGTGKTKIASSIASTFEACSVYNVLSSHLVDKFVGSSERNFRALFTIAQEHAPAVVILDEAETLFGIRQSGSQSEGSTQRLTTELLALMSKFDKVVIVALTNLPWKFDDAFFRRFDRHIHVGLPDLQDRQAILELVLDSHPHELKARDIGTLAALCASFSGDAVQRAVFDVLNDGYKRARRATHFREVSFKGKNVFHACAQGSDGALELAWSQVKDRLYPEPVTFAALEASIKRAQRNVKLAEEKAAKHTRWAEEPFQEL